MKILRKLHNKYLPVYGWGFEKIAGLFLGEFLDFFFALRTSCGQTPACDDALLSERVSGSKYIWKWLRKGWYPATAGVYVLPYKHNHSSPYLLFASKVTTVIVDSIVPQNAA